MKKYKLKTYEGDHKRIIITKEFVEKNNLKYTRTNKEILEKIKNAGMFDDGLSIFIHYLDWEHAKRLYKDEFVKKVDSGKEKKPKKITDIYETAQDFLDYMVFGWMKALDERGLSASRTVNKLGHWLWIMGREDLKELVNDDSLFNPYGMPALIAVCEKMGIEVPKDCREFAGHKC